MKKDHHFPELTLNSNLDLTNKNIVVIGGTGGLGQALSQKMAALGADILVVGQTFRDQKTRGIRFLQADLSLMSEAKRIADAIPAESIDMLIFTTGIFAAPQREETAEGIERDLAVSYLNRFVILNHLAHRLGRDKADKIRVFVMAYPGAGEIGQTENLNWEHSYKAMPAHMNTVAGNEILVHYAAKLFPHFKTFGINPGVVKTNIRSNWLGNKKLLSGVLEGLIGLLNPTPSQFAERLVPILFAPELESCNGALLTRTEKALCPSKGIQDNAHINAFIQGSYSLVKKTKTAIQQPQDYS